MESPGSALSFAVDHEHGWATLRKGDVCLERSCLWAEVGSQSSALVPFLKGILEEAEQDPLQLGLVVAPRGPASFTTLRLTLAVAKAFAFALPNARVFSPSWYQVLAFAVRPQIPPESDVLVLIDSFQQGVYGAIFRNEPPFRPWMRTPSELYSREDAAAFLSAHADLPCVTDVGPQSSTYPLLDHLARPPMRLQGQASTLQLELFEVPRSLHDAEKDAAFAPFYGHTPQYVKQCRA